MTTQKAEQIARQFNHKMQHLYKIMDDGNRLKKHHNDVAVILDDRYVDMWEAVEPWLGHAEEVWSYCLNTDEKAKEELKFPSIGAFAGWSMLETLYKRIDGYQQHDLQERSRLIYENRQLIEEKLVETGEWNIDYKSPTFLEIYKNTGLYGDDYPCEGDRKRLIYTISEEMKKVLCL